MTTGASRAIPSYARVTERSLSAKAIMRESTNIPGYMGRFPGINLSREIVNVNLFSQALINPQICALREA